MPTVADDPTTAPSLNVGWPRRWSAKDLPTYPVPPMMARGSLWSTPSPPPEAVEILASRTASSERTVRESAGCE